ncbi:hypothetical protein SPBRAN_1766 [uncultured Candidatus Thioglobus sp.]|nr:hypothetical protein SPBRAN_1766 [uncultured Candidatus Thioglobus sp.]
MNPEKVCSYQFTTVLNLDKRFPQVGLADSKYLDLLREEFMDFTLSPMDHPSLSTYKSATGEKPRAGVFWHEVSKIRALDGVRRFPSLTNLMAGLLSIPSSNADSERGFSILRKIHTDQRGSLKQSTIISLMTMKFNCDECCYETKFTEELLSKCKKATSISLNH